MPARMQEPRRVVDRYAAGEGSEDGGEPKAFVSVNWVLTEEPLDLETELVGYLCRCAFGVLWLALWFVWCRPTGC